MSKASQYREMNAEQLAFALRETQQELFQVRFQAASEQLDAPSHLRRLRRQIARIKTIQTELGFAAAPAVAAEGGTDTV